MGKIEDKIKQDLLQEVFTDTFKIYEFIDIRFKLDEKTRSEVISKINSLNNDLTTLLKDVKLS
jgi:ubiquinone/menaquinone biosynthesis C-methylase UbiE